MAQNIHRHGRSEIWKRTQLVEAVQKERVRLGNRLRAERLKRHLTQEQASELIGIHPYHLRRIESGTQSVSLTVLVAAAIAYHLPLRSLFAK